jgi:hypothetical protein
VDMPRKMDRIYALKNGRGFIYWKHLCPEFRTELRCFLCPEYCTERFNGTKGILTGKKRL